MVQILAVTRKGRALRMTLFGAACAAFGAWTPLHAAAVGPKNTLKLVRSIPHSGYSEGLDLHDGFLWNALPKEILKINPGDGSVVSRYTPASDYSESLTWFQGALWNLSFANNGIYKGKLAAGQFAFKRVGSVPEVHGWGITHDGNHLVVTGEYSSKLYFLDSRTAKVIRTLETDKTALEDLAWDGVGFWTSSFTSDRGHIFRIHPKTGKSGPLYQLPDPESCPVIDGIAVDGKNLWVTGKNCPSIYLFERPL